MCSLVCLPAFIHCLISDNRLFYCFQPQLPMFTSAKSAAVGIYPHLFIYSTMEEHLSCLHRLVVELCCYNYVNYVGDTVINHRRPF